MKFGLMNFFGQPECYFNVSYRVNKALSDIVQKNIFNKPPFKGVKKEWVFSVNITSNKEVEKLTILNKPRYDKVNKFECYTLVFPSTLIVKNEFPLNDYIDLFFEGLEILLKSFEIKEDSFVSCVTEAKKLILNAKKYELKEGEGFSKPIDESETMELIEELKRINKTRLK